MEVVVLENVLGKRLRTLRERANLSQKRAAKIFGITNFQLSRYENGQSNPDPDLIAKFAEHYEVTTDYLHGLTDNPSSRDKQSDELSEQFPVLADIDPELLQKFAETIKEDPYQSLFFDDILSADREEREQIVREWLELRRKYKDRKKDEPPEDDGPSVWDIVRNKNR